jgi:molybdate transport system substrate-binding protein
MIRPLRFLIAAALAGLGTTAFAQAGAVSVAAAANLVFALEALHAGFRAQAPEVALTSTTGASGSLFAQIQHGAPFDVFLSADTDYPRKLVAAGRGDAGSLRTFAVGRLVVWTLRSDLDLADLAAVVRAPGVTRIALAQPRTAPYGRAARAVLEKLGVWETVQPRVVLGESISQTAQFVETGNATLGFVAKSFVVSPGLRATGSWREVPADLHPGVSLDHAVVLTTRGAANPAARRYLEFLGSEPARKILRDFGYGVP